MSDYEVDDSALEKPGLAQDAGATRSSPGPGSSSAEEDVTVNQPTHASTDTPTRSSRRPATTKRRGVAKSGVTGSARNVPSEPVRPSTCPRWMHHRAGVYCKECGK